ncbi:MAG: phage major capsid protein, partial [Rhodoblastus sp.]|nr:phage major capsid protein [Rhodoblastus sp.]
MHDLENKSYASEAAAFEDLHRAFAAFRETNDERFGQIERRLTSDVITEEKLTRIDRALDETKSRLDRFALENARPRLGGSVKTDHVEREHKAAFGLYMRAREAGGLKAIAQKAMSRGSGPDGGYLVPVPTPRDIMR